MSCKPPRIHTQLDNGQPTAAWDCGVEGIIRALDFASCGKVIIDEPEARRRANQPGKQATDPRDWKRAIEHPATVKDFKRVGLRPPRARLLDGADVDVAVKGLQAGQMLHAAAWYGTLNVVRPDKSGSLTFDDNHAIGWLGHRVNGMRRAVTVQYDPLADGRKRVVAGHMVTYPKGPQTIGWATVEQMLGDVRVRTRDAAGNIVEQHRLGNGRVLGILTPRAKPLVKPPVKPPVKPTDPPVINPEPPTDVDQAEQLAAARQGLAAAVAYSVAARAALDALDDDLDQAITASGGPL